MADALDERMLEGSDASQTSSDDDFLDADQIVGIGAPHEHTYLGTLDEVVLPAEGALQPGGAQLLTLPLLRLPHVVLFPGGTLPLREHLQHTWQHAPLEAALAATGALQGLLAVSDMLSPRAGDTLCVARVSRASRPADGSLVVVASGVGRATARAVRLEDAHGGAAADVTLLPEAEAPSMPPPRCAHHGAEAWHAASPRRLAQRLRAQPALLGVAPSAEALAAKTPSQLAYWAAAALPLDTRQRKVCREPSSHRIAQAPCSCPSLAGAAGVAAHRRTTAQPAVVHGAPRPAALRWLRSGLGARSRRRVRCVGRRSGRHVRQRARLRARHAHRARRARAGAGWAANDPGLLVSGIRVDNRSLRSLLCARRLALHGGRARRQQRRQRWQDDGAASRLLGAAPRRVSTQPRQRRCCERRRAGRLIVWTLVCRLADWGTASAHACWRRVVVLHAGPPVTASPAERVASRRSPLVQERGQGRRPVRGVAQREVRRVERRDRNRVRGGAVVGPRVGQVLAQRRERALVRDRALREEAARTEKAGGAASARCTRAHTRLLQRGAGARTPCTRPWPGGRS